MYEVGVCTLGYLAFVCFCCHLFLCLLLTFSVFAFTFFLFLLLPFSVFAVTFFLVFALLTFFCFLLRRISAFACVTFFCCVLLQCERSVFGVNGDGPDRQRRVLLEVRAPSPGPQDFGHHGLAFHFDRYRSSPTMVRIE